MRAARFPATVELIGTMMQMPPGARIVGACMSDDMRCVVLTVDDPSLPEADDPHDVEPVITRETVRWDWNLKGGDA